MKLSIIALNYNSSEKTIYLLRSLQDQTDQDFQTIIIDNASEETDFKTLSTFVNETTSQVVLLRNEQNLGFSGGNNIGIKKALTNGSNWMILLNNDTWVENGFITSLKAKLSQLDGVVGVPLVENDQTVYCGNIEWLKPTLKHSYLLPNDRYRKTVNYAIGGAMALHKDIFNRIGFMDEKYFLYFEDADLSIRTQKAGLKMIFLEKPKVYHHISSTTKKLGSPLLLRYHYRNALYFNLKNGPWYIKVMLWPWSWTIILKQIFKVIIYHNRNESLAILKGVFDFYKNKMGKI